MAQGGTPKIRIRIKAFDHRLLDQSAAEILDTALQTIRFRLDKSGADLESEAQLMALPVPSHYRFDRPFLVLMRKRGAARPFFAMWVDNAELMTRAGAPEDPR